MHHAAVTTLTRAGTEYLEKQKPNGDRRGEEFVCGVMYILLHIITCVLQAKITQIWYILTRQNYCFMCIFVNKTNHLSLIHLYLSSLNSLKKKRRPELT